MKNRFRIVSETRDRTESRWAEGSSAQRVPIIAHTIEDRTMPTLDSLKQALGDETKDLRLNLGTVLSAGSLEPSHRYAVALTSALFLRADGLAEAIRSDGNEYLDEWPSPTPRPQRRSWP